MMGAYSSRPSERDMTIFRRRNDGETFVAISRDYGITPGRVNQVYRRMAQRLRFIARVTGTCPTCHQQMAQI
jgi:Mor family transcriptional regulator